MKMKLELTLSFLLFAFISVGVYPSACDGSLIRDLARKKEGSRYSTSTTSPQKPPTAKRQSLCKKITPSLDENSRSENIESVPITGESEYPPSDETTSSSRPSPHPKKHCNLNEFITSDFTTLKEQIASQGSECVNKLFNAPYHTQFAVFKNDNVFEVTKHAKALSVQYNGSNSELGAVFLFIRAAYFVEFYNDNFQLESRITTGTREAIDAFVKNGNFYDYSDEHGKVLSEVITTMDSAELNHLYLGVAKIWLNRWDPEYANNWYFRNTLNQIFVLLHRGGFFSTFKEKVKSDNDLTMALRKVVFSQWMLGTKSEFLISNAGGELARLLKYHNDTVPRDLKSALTELFSTYSMSGNGDSIWIRAAIVVEYNHRCSDFNTCGFEERLETTILSTFYTCGHNIEIRAQNFNTTQKRAACEKLVKQEDIFHSKLQTGRTPVSDDFNAKLRINIFNSENDYRKYAGSIFNINTNNGGMYLEGTPSVRGNIPNFVAYEASYGKPDHFVWNLEHEFIHYLDGRFNLYGGFNAPTEKIVWWSEGVAEYISLLGDNKAAVTTIKTGPKFQLYEIFETDYFGSSDRIYKWGYLGVRFMVENHFNDVQDMLSKTREGNWAAYKSNIDRWGSSYGNEFTKWTLSLATKRSSGGGGTKTSVPDSCTFQGPQTEGTLEPRIPVCLGNQEHPMYFDINYVNEYENITITSAKGTGNINLEYSNKGWPLRSNIDDNSTHPGNYECIFIVGGQQTWSYLKVTGSAEGATVILDFNTDGCRSP